jgi:hypothetical protein
MSRTSTTRQPACRLPSGEQQRLLDTRRAPAQRRRGTRTPTGSPVGRCRGRLCMHLPLLLQQSASLLLAVVVSTSPPDRLACGLPASSALSDTQQSSTPSSGTGRSGETLAWRTHRWRTLAWNPIIMQCFSRLHGGAIEASDGGGGEGAMRCEGCKRKSQPTSQVFGRGLIGVMNEGPGLPGLPRLAAWWPQACTTYALLC